MNYNIIKYCLLLQQSFKILLSDITKKSVEKIFFMVQSIYTDGVGHDNYRRCRTRS